MMMLLLLRFLPLLLLCIAAFLFWRMHLKKRTAEEERQHIPWYKQSWLWMVVAAIMIALFTAFLSVMLERQGNYIPAQYKDGKFVPGRYE